MTPRDERPLLYLITPGTLVPADFNARKAELLDAVRRAAEAGVSLVQIREKNLEARQLFELVVDAVDIASSSGTRILVNERFDVALAAAAHGVHLPAAALDPLTVSKHVPEGFLIGVSAHDTDQVRRAIDGGADFATFGPVFLSPGKGEPLGVKVLRDVCAEFPDIPLFALGGIDETNLDDVLDAGCAGIAAIRLLNDPASLGRVAGRVKLHALS